VGIEFVVISTNFVSSGICGAAYHSQSVGKTERRRRAARSVGAEARIEPMSEKSGETARETGDYRCEHCHGIVRMQAGVLIPICPHCGSQVFDLSNPGFEMPDGTLGPHEPG
jgi:DNA-directed RNA polymerase subunit RPC12/RpoP